MTSQETSVLTGLLRSLEKIEQRLDASDAHLTAIDTKLDDLHRRITSATHGMEFK